ncbi:APC family permease [Streptococcus sobrinus]|uniref:APC family permease n=3 Tax=Streptococcus sobrinus TaxID=1310 RepID=A0ABM6W7H5_9STRE|nr:APC family permease [Streptococcus sobrinus]AWN21648.1 APC family permease [Streptococcus sobrinus]EMP72693.1 transporter [Streptococcus sobrinus DSM 20742 = ATCC 33478]SQG14490.1 APC family amino acid-polyamine-organocation transporter [Streptococcus sobrinus]
MLKRLKALFIGDPLISTNEGDDTHLLSKKQALAMLSSDALSSIAYGPEQIILILVAVSPLAIWWSLPIGLMVLVLLASLTISYQQVIHAYPKGGGAYVVSSENLSPSWGLIAGGSLLVDYMLTVAVSVSSGADAITSAFPVIKEHNLGISVVLVLVLMVMNLRGLRESARSLMIPVYLFIVSILFLLLYGSYQIIVGHLPYMATAHIGQSVSGVSMILLLRAFTSGSASLTGVEAISNAVPFFKKPKEKNASATLGFMALILGLMFAGITFLNFWLGILPSQHVTVLAQIAKTVYGNSVLGNVFFYIFQLATAFILAVAANTGFSAFPMLSFNMAKNKYMPHLFMEKGARLGYSNGIITLALGAIALLFIFNGSTERLIPLYTIGVFIPFALSQTGMVIHWRRTLKHGYLGRSLANILGALICYGIILILLVFRLGDIWPFFPIIIALLGLFNAIKRHYSNVAMQLRITEGAKAIPYQGNTVLVLVGNMTKASIPAINYARSIGQRVLAMHVATLETKEKDKELEEEFKDYFPEIPLVMVESNYRDIVKPTMMFVQEILEESKKNGHTLTVVIPKFIPKHGWQNVLHNQMSLRLRASLRWHEDIVIATYSYHLKK